VKHVSLGAARFAERGSAWLLEHHSPVALLFFGVSALIYAALAVNGPRGSPLFAQAVTAPVYRGAVLALGCLSALMLITASEQVLHVAAGMHLAGSLLLLLLFRQPEPSLALLLVAGLVPLGLYEPFPLSLCLCGAYGALFVAAGAMFGGLPAFSALALALVGGTVGCAASLMGRYWERLVALQAHATRLEDNVAVLARANSLSQDYARDIEEESRAAERLSLTRDIHDTIGYTLTNTIMAMEAVKMMVRSEPGRVGEYLETTRRNTEEGLAHIKRILREFRSRQKSEDSCLFALKKLVKVFTLSTGLDVRFELGNVEAAVLDRFGECVYHFVQEGLINAFRHGRARRATLLCWDYGDRLRLTMDDDGSGCAGVLEPGIGISGMMERARAFGGRVAVERGAAGFRISMYLVKGGADAGRG
jgi:signal transduction histidine kinase